MKNILSRTDLQTSARMFTLACMYSRKHSAVVAESFEKYGYHGSQISGIIRDHFPEPIKAQLRELCTEISMCSIAAWDHKPRGVRDSTMRKLSQAIAKRDGSGFYGPQG